MAAMKLLLSQARRHCLIKPPVPSLRRYLSSSTDTNPVPDPPQRESPRRSPVSVQPVSYAIKPKQPSETASNEDTPSPSLSPPQRQRQPAGSEESLSEETQPTWTREDIRYVKNSPSISPVSYPTRVAPLPEDKVAGPEEGEEGSEEARDANLAMERERRRFEVENRARRRGFRLAVEDEKEVLPFPLLIKPEKKQESKPVFDLMDAIKEVKANARSSFDETLEAHVRLGIEKGRSELIVRGTLALPHATKKDVRVAFFAEGDDAEEARAAGADIVGGIELVEEIASNSKFLQFLHKKKKMKTHICKSILKHSFWVSSTSIRSKTTSAQYVSSRARDATFEKFMDNYKNYLKVVSVQDLILANPTNNPPSVSIDFLSKLSQKLHLNRGAASFLRKYPHIFHIYYDTVKSQPLCGLTDNAVGIARLEANAINASIPHVVDRLVRLLSMSITKSLPLRAVFKVWRELGLPDDFEDSVISKHSNLFRLRDGNEPNTHTLKLTDEMDKNPNRFTSSVEDWRIVECCKPDCVLDRTQIRFSFKHSFPPGMRLTKNFKSKVKQWQALPYVGPYDENNVKKTSKKTTSAAEKRAVAIVHEFLSLTVEKMVEVEKISHFKKWFGIEDMNIRDLFLDHPGMFYLSTKGKRHTVFLREGYERGCLINPNPVYNARRKLLDLVVLGRHGLLPGYLKLEETN